MLQIHKFWSHFENISRDSRVTVTQQLRDIRESVSRLTRNVAYFHLYDSLATFVRVSHNIRANVALFYFLTR